MIFALFKLLIALSRGVQKLIFGLVKVNNLGSAKIAPHFKTKPVICYLKLKTSACMLFKVF